MTCARAPVQIIIGIISDEVPHIIVFLLNFATRWGVFVLGLYSNEYYLEGEKDIFNYVFECSCISER